MKFFFWAWVIGFLGSAWSAAPQQSLLSGDKLQVLKRQDCTFVHVWATWCTVCMEEMPHLLSTLKDVKRVHPVIIDVSTPYVQDSQSKKWMASLNPPFPTYLKPKGDDAEYMEQVDKAWSGALPYSVLFDRGTKKKEWIGSLPLEEMKIDLAKLCH